MCRFVAYLGEPILAEDLITKPKNSLIHQSYHAEEMSTPLNGDGFGMGWYVKQIREEPGLYKSVTPAWNDQNLKINAGIIKSNCIMAHIRSATEGSVSIENSHPFRYNQYLMMHNGGIPKFSDIKRDVINRLSNHYFKWVKGQTDSEYIFALYMQTVANLSDNKKGEELPLSFLADCFRKLFNELETIKAERKIKRPSVYNLVISDGKRLLATRYSTDPNNESRTLYYSRGQKYVCEGNQCRMIPENGSAASILIVSEKLDEFVDEWVPVADNTILLIDEDLTITQEKL
jgi:predicted glutamine amidotransferase